MNGLRALKVTAAGVVAVLIAHMTARMHREPPALDQAAVAAYLLPAQPVEPDSIGRLRARQFGVAAPTAQGSNTSGFVQPAAAWGAAMNASGRIDAKG